MIRGKTIAWVGLMGAVFVWAACNKSSDSSESPPASSSPSPTSSTSPATSGSTSTSPYVGVCTSSDDATNGACYTWAGTSQSLYDDDKSACEANPKSKWASGAGTCPTSNMIGRCIVAASVAGQSYTKTMHFYSTSTSNNTKDGAKSYCDSIKAMAAAGTTVTWSDS